MTPDERHAVLSLIHTICDLIRESEPMGIPSGVLYSSLLGVCSLGSYMDLIGGLEREGYIRQSNHVLYPTAKLLGNRN